MKTGYLSAFFLIVIFFSLPFAAGQSYGFDYEFTSADSEEIISYTQYEGKPVLIDLFATWCEPCKVEVLHVQEIYEQVKDQVHIMSISIDPTTDSLEKIRKFRDQFEATWTFGLDHEGELRDIYNVSKLPYLLLLDETGNIVKEWVGITDTSKVYASLKSEFDIVIDNPEGSNDVEILLSRLFSNIVFQVSSVISGLMIIYIIISNVMNKEDQTMTQTE